MFGEKKEERNYKETEETIKLANVKLKRGRIYDPIGVAVFSSICKTSRLMYDNKMRETAA